MLKALDSPDIGAYMMFLVITSMYTTVVISLERYLAVSKPIMAFVERDERNWKKVFSILVPLMAGSFLLSFPLSFEFFVDPFFK